MVSLFETRFGFRRTAQSLRAQYDKIYKRGDLTEHKHGKPAPAAQCKSRGSSCLSSRGPCVEIWFAIELNREMYINKEVFDKAGNCLKL